MSKAKRDGVTGARLVLAILASDADGYRRWWWSQGKPREAELLVEWGAAIRRHGLADGEIREGLRRWRAGDPDLLNPPTPGALVEMLRPAANRARLLALREALSG